ncbi:hypothetical protein [Nocardia sp. SC052]|uniref:hypothetical protein n=1 Tax=Nocardia sichangensis TaxID=3385975 RepID=UPI00399F763E
MYLHGCPSMARSDAPARPSWAVPLLEPAELFKAISGRLASGSPLVNWARELSDLHAELTRHKRGGVPCSSGFDCERIRAGIERLVDDIDMWAARNVPRTNCARKHTHSLGEAISHIAQTYSEAWWTVLHSADCELRHEAWSHLGEVREGYAGMVGEIRARHLQLPLGAGVRGRSK